MFRLKSAWNRNTISSCECVFGIEHLSLVVGTSRHNRPTSQGRMRRTRSQSRVPGSRLPALNLVATCAIHSVGTQRPCASRESSEATIGTRTLYPRGHWQTPKRKPTAWDSADRQIWASACRRPIRCRRKNRLLTTATAPISTTLPSSSAITSRVPSPRVAYRTPACHGERTDCRPVQPLDSTYARCGHRRRHNIHPIRAS
ncbi:MAG: hypothetical protein JWQ87_115 [Candidatus Sulfotelmatobacter sp.]|nr:hypothetical protein [Candidatus Sulfotelmatobacter sp.]